MENRDYQKGRGAQVNPHNPFRELELVTEHPEGIDEPMAIRPGKWNVAGCIKQLLLG